MLLHNLSELSKHCHNNYVKPLKNEFGQLKSQLKVSLNTMDHHFYAKHHTSQKQEITEYPQAKNISDALTHYLNELLNIQQRLVNDDDIHKKIQGILSNPQGDYFGKNRVPYQVIVQKKIYAECGWNTHDYCPYCKDGGEHYDMVHVEKTIHLSKQQDEQIKQLKSELLVDKSEHYQMTIEIKNFTLAIKRLIQQQNQKSLSKDLYLDALLYIMINAPIFAKKIDIDIDEILNIIAHLVLADRVLPDNIPNTSDIIYRLIVIGLQKAQENPDDCYFILLHSFLNLKTHELEPILEGCLSEKMGALRSQIDDESMKILHHLFLTSKKNDYLKTRIISILS